MTEQQYHHLLHAIELLDGVESLLDTLPYAKGRNRKMARLRADITQTMQADMKQLRSVILKLI